MGRWAGSDVWVVTYDIARERERRRVATLLAARGPRVLYSVFEVSATSHGMDRLFERASAGLDPDDRLLAVPTCRSCGQARIGAPLEAGDTRAVVL